MRRVLVLIAVSCIPMAASCEKRPPLEPTSSVTLDQFVQALRQQGLNVSLAGEILPEANRFFSVPAHQVRVNETQVSAFVYHSAEAAAAEAARISEDGQPSPTVRVTWVSTPRFYRQDSLIVLYVGCSPEVIQALQATVGTPVAIGRTPCELGR
jgi:hypothetical protein